MLHRNFQSRGSARLLLHVLQTGRTAQAPEKARLAALPALHRQDRPVCAAKMVKTKIQGLNIEIDTCYSCGGIFLDNEELELIRESMQKTPYQKAQEPNNNVQNGYSANLKMNDKLGSNGTSLRDFYRDAVREENKYDHHVAEFSDVFGLFFRRRGIWDLLDLFF